MPPTNSLGVNGLHDLLDLLQGVTHDARFSLRERVFAVETLCPGLGILVLLRVVPLYARGANVPTSPSGRFVVALPPIFSGFCVTGNTLTALALTWKLLHTVSVAVEYSFINRTGPGGSRFLPALAR